MQYTDAQNALTDYINAWLKAAKPCLSLTAVLGVNNSIFVEQLHLLPHVMEITGYR